MAAKEEITEREFTRLYDAMEKLGKKIDKIGEEVTNIRVDFAKVESRFVTKKEVRWTITIIVAAAIAIISYFSQKPLVP